MEKIAVLDSGGQYCHLIARKVRELGVYAEIHPIGVAPSKLKNFKGIILSGGPASVFDDDSPQPSPRLFQLERPMLGICYGHQLMARYLDGTVERGDTHEFGRANLRIRCQADLFSGLADRQRVWMSHGDHVGKLPPGFVALADTSQCEVAAMGHLERGLFGIQFHPEVVHTPNGLRMLRNFLENTCGCQMDWRPRDRAEQLKQLVRKQTKGRRVLFFLSGGVDSMVAYTLTVQAIGSERVEAIYVDTGFMRSGETAEIEAAFRSLNLGRLQVAKASKMFLGRLKGVVDPEEKRAIIGKAFVDLQDDVLEGDHFSGHDWMLGQGTIYPDTIESGGTKSAAVIKTHHNRVERIQELISEGRVIEPLVEFYKDEVRELGYALGLTPQLIERHPFPGPGLAIRCLCNDTVAKPELDNEIAAVAKRAGYRSFLLPLHSVGVQGDSRSYAKVTVLHGGPHDYAKLLPVATSITNEFRRTNRIVVALSPKRLVIKDWKIKRATLTKKRVALLQSADRMVTEFLQSERLYFKIWQCPVVLLPLTRTGGETIALRPITSVDGMTAAVAKLPAEALLALARRIRAIDGVDAVLYDISHKPPSTIEWE
jgi:GMP synthase (glutamine-hydrolysing)